MKFLAIDPSLTATGVAPEYMDPRTWHVPAAIRGEARLAVIRDLLVDEITEPRRPDLVVIEGYSHGSRYNREALGELGGVLRLALFDAGIPFVVIAPKTVKKFATGKGNADKHTMRMEAYKRGDIEFEDDNACDAWWLRQLALTRYEPSRAVVVPAAQRAVAEDCTDWPAHLPEVD